MLRPQDNGIRETKRLDGLWDFVADAAGAGWREEWWRGALPSPLRIPVPSSFNDVFVEDNLHEHVGDVWYQRSLAVPRGWAGRRIVLRFDSATHRATVWVNDTEVMSHEGGYMPFEADIAPHVVPGSVVRLTVVVNNELTWQSIPPGVLTTKADGTKKQRYYHDFFNYAGLHRSVWLSSLPTTAIADITVTTDIDGSTGVVRYSQRVVGVGDGESDGEVTSRVTLANAAGTEVARSEGATGELRVPDAELWRPGRGYLYRLTAELVAADGEVVDRYELPVGIRTVRVEGLRFLINGEPFYFRGFGMHEDANIRGKGHDQASMVHDFELLAWTGANSFRTSHYPYAEEWLDEADRRGVVVIDETAAVGLNLGIGGGFFLGGSYTTFSPETINAATQSLHREAIRELIDRDKNHPSVVMWCLANEPESDTDASLDYFTPLFEFARTADPTRPLTFTNMLLAPYDKCKVSSLCDVVLLNRYYGWYIDLGDIAAAAQNMERELLGWQATHGKPLVLAEYGADAIPGLRSLAPVPWSEDYQAAVLDMSHEVFDRVEAVVGEQMWNFADFMTTLSFMRVDGNKKGVFTRDRTPKQAAFHLRRRWRGDRP